MPKPIRIPRINNNDDTVLLSFLYVEAGVAVHAGDPIADIETDKAAMTVEAEEDGYVLEIRGAVGNPISVGSILCWTGVTPDEPVPVETAGQANLTQNRQSAEPTLKAALLLAQLGLSAADVPFTGGRLTVADVLNHTERAGTSTTSVQGPVAPGRRIELTPAQRGMARTVQWHRDECVPGYIEIEYDPSQWETYASAFQKLHKLLMSPLLALMARRLARIAHDNPDLNATLVGNDKYIYDEVRLGFTVMVGSTLYLAVVDCADVLDEREFVNRLGELQRSAMKHSLEPAESSGATVAFSSMARWRVSRHVPILPPNTAFIVAHTAPRNGTAFLGASYDHRLLTGSDVVQALNALSKPT